MKTVEEIRELWKAIRPEIGNLLCFIDGKINQIEDIEQAYKKGIEYAQMLEDERTCHNCKYNANAKTEEPCVYCSKAYTNEFIQWKPEPEKTNFDKFVETFGFAPGYEFLADGSRHYPSLNIDFWNEPYKEPAEDGKI